MLKFLSSIQSLIFKALKSAKNFIVSKKYSLLLISFLIVPVIAFFRVIFNQIFQFQSIIFITFLFCFYFWLYLSLFYDKKFDNRLNSLFFKAINTRVVQDLLFICLQIEQFTMLSPYFLQLFWLPFSLLGAYFNFPFKGPLFEGLFQILFILILLYYRLRVKFLNVIAFAEAGVKIPEGPLTWGFILKGLTAVINHQKPSAAQEEFVSQPSCAPRRDKGARPAEGGPTNMGSSLVARPIRVPNFPDWQIIDKMPARKDIVFPFFPNSQRRGLSGKAAFKELVEATVVAAQKDPSGIIRAGVLSIGAVFAGVSAIILQEQQIAAKDRETQANLASKMKEIETNYALRMKELETNSALRMKELDSMIAYQQQDILLRRERLDFDQERFRAIQSEASQVDNSSTLTVRDKLKMIGLDEFIDTKDSGDGPSENSKMIPCAHESSSLLEFKKGFYFILDRMVSLIDVWW